MSEIDAEASARSLTAVETAIAEALRDAEAGVQAAPADPAPAPSPAFAETSFRSRHPAPVAGFTPAEQAIFERSPQVSLASAPAAIGELVADPSARPDFPVSEVKRWNLSDYSALAKRVGRIAGIVAAGWLAIVLLLILVYRFVNPPMSALMVQKWLLGENVVHQWVPIEDMSANIVRAVILSEDGRFCEHYGVDYEAMQDAVRRAAGSGPPRGASTISMQVIKNLFLWPSKSYLRKIIELPLTYAMELVWPKRRIMEVYLNIAEWGPGIFGVGAAAQFHFNKTARNLSEREAARLAVALPNPITRDPRSPGPGTQRLATAVQFRMRLAPTAQTACVLPKRRI